MGWLKDFFCPGPYQIATTLPVKSDEELLQEGLDRGEVHWVVWKYVRVMSFTFGPESFYDWMRGLRKGLESGEITREDVLRILDLEEN